jgi:hypothetical protein
MVKESKRTYDLFDNLIQNLFIAEVCVSKLCNQTGKEIETENKEFNKHIIPWGKFFIIQLSFVSLI